MFKNWIAVIAAAVLLLAAAGILIFLSRSRIDGPALIRGFREDESDPVMLVDYCVKTVATVGGDGYRETVLYQHRDGSCEIHYYRMYDADSEEAHSAYSADGPVIAKVYAIINREHIADWNDRKYSRGPHGIQYVLKFRGSDGEYVRVTSDSIPKDGIEVFQKVGECLSAHAGEKIDLP